MLVPVIGYAEDPPSEVNDVNITQLVMVKLVYAAPRLTFPICAAVCIDMADVDGYNP